MSDAAGACSIVSGDGSIYRQYIRDWLQANLRLVRRSPDVELWGSGMLWNFILRLRFHLTTILVGFFAGIGMVVIARGPHWWERDGRYMFGVPGIVAFIMWARIGLANLANDQAGDAEMLLLPAEKLFVAYLAFAIGLGLAFLLSLSG